MLSYEENIAFYDVLPAFLLDKLWSITVKLMKSIYQPNGRDNSLWSQLLWLGFDPVEGIWTDRPIMLFFFAVSNTMQSAEKELKIVTQGNARQK